MKTTLRDINPGERCKIVKINFKGELHKRVMEMGVTPGTVVEVERYAPLGDPIELKVKGYHLSLRKDEAACVDVEKI
ncbi:MAG: ferrous iron transport protein A [Deferribacterales bacterium]|nr:ferrous iron transport protein A [Deferribacterales bacterium]